MTYEQLDARLTGRNQRSRKLANNTYAERRDAETIAIRLHATDVVTYHKDGRVVLNDGGWLTVTTKERMNSFGPDYVSIGSNKGRWYVVLAPRPPVTDQYRDWANPVPYADGITFKDGKVWSGGVDRATVAAEDAANDRTRKDITNFVRRIKPAEVVAALDNMGGDCLFCQLRDKQGRPMGDDLGDHLREHMAEHYVVGSMIVNAVKERGYRDPSYILSYIYSTAKGEHRAPAVDRMLTDALRKYLRKRLTVGAVATA
jgi:hypothetical protein